MTNSELIESLEQAKALLSKVYAWSNQREPVDDFNVFTTNPTVARLMSVADSCIEDAIEALEWDNE